MKKYIYILAGAALFTGCEKKETTITNPPAENQTENNTTIVKESRAPSSKTENNTTIVNESKAPSKTERHSTNPSPSP
jgi:PBP1b-binding outer membrane lipoprotein LpoB